MNSEHCEAQGSQAAETDLEEDLELDEFIPMTGRGLGDIIMEGFEVAGAVTSDNEEISELSNGFAKLASQSDQCPRSSIEHPKRTSFLRNRNTTGAT